MLKPHSSLRDVFNDTTVTFSGIQTTTKSQQMFDIFHCNNHSPHFPCFICKFFWFPLPCFHLGLKIAVDQYKEGWQLKKRHNPEEEVFSPHGKCVGSANDLSTTEGQKKKIYIKNSSCSKMISQWHQHYKSLIQFLSETGNFLCFVL